MSGEPHAGDETPLKSAADDQRTVSLGTDVGAGEAGTNSVEALDEGTEIGPFVVERRLGAGGMGVVYAAGDPRLNRRVALKLILTEWGRPPSAAQRRRIQHEARVMAALNHPNVVPVYDFGLWRTLGGDTHLYVAMELVQGRDAAAWIGAKPRSRAEIIEVYRDAAMGLAAAHRAGIVHRDFKPHNVIVGDDGRARVTDFGVAIVTEEPSSEVVSQPWRDEASLVTAPHRRGDVAGTPAYMAPEQREGDGVDARADQYSWCVALVEALCGQRPAATGSVVIPTKLDDDPIRDVLVRGLSPRAEDRFTDMDAVLVAMKRAEGARGRLPWVVGLVGLASAAALLQLPPSEPGCVEGAVALAEVWTPAAQARIERERSTAGNVETTAWDRVQDAMQHRTQRWVALRDEVCASDERQGQAEACLAERRVELRTLDGVLRDASEVDVEKFLATVEALDDLDACAGAGARADAPSELVGRLRAESAAADVLMHTARYDDALKRIESLLEEARPLGDAPIVADLHLRRGALFEQLGRFDAAVESLSRAYFIALTSAADSTAFEAARIITFVLGERTGDADGALQWARHARMSLERLGSPPESEAKLLNSIGAAHQGRRAWDEAEQAHRRALELRMQVLPRDAADIAVTRNNLANTLIETQRYDEAMQHHREAQRIWATTLGENHPAVAMSLFNQGNVAYLQKRYDEALTRYQQSKEIYAERLGPQSSGVADALFGIGRTHQRMDDHGKALEYYGSAREIWRAEGPASPKLAITVADFAAALAGQGQAAAARKELLEGIELRARLYGPEHDYTIQLQEQLDRLELDRVAAGE